MKKINVFWIVAILLLFRQCAMAQQVVPKAKAAFIPSYHLEISYEKTSNIIFPYAIKSVDRGSQVILAQKPLGSKNVLQLKAAKKGFAETNLSVITDGNKFYSFIVDYNNSPAQLNWDFSSNHPVLTKDKHLNEAIFLADTKQILADRNFVQLKQKQYDIVMRLQGIYASANAILLKIQFQNKSNINYDIESLRFVIKDKHQAKRTAVQERALQPLYVYQTQASIVADSNTIAVYALPKFSLSNKKYLDIELAEENGGRNLQLKLKSRALPKAKKL